MNTTTAVTGYDEFRAKVSEVRDACNFIPDVSSDEGYTKSKRIALDVGKILTSVEKKRKELKSESLEYGRKIDAEAKHIVAELEVFQLPHKAAYKELDQLKKDREDRRKADLESRVEAMRSLPEAMADSDSNGIKAAMEDLSKEECLDFYEYTDQALKARNASKEALSIMFAAKLKQEAEAKELAELRKKQAEQDQKDRDERIAKEASEKADKEAAASKAAELDAIKQAAEATRQKEAAEKQAKIDAEKAKTQKAEAEKQAKIDAANAAEDARKAQIALQEEKEAAEKQARIDAAKAAEDARKAQIALQEEKEAAERKEIEKREANKKHVGAIRKAAKEDIMALGVDETTAKDIVLAINDGKISGVTINY